MSLPSGEGLSLHAPALRRLRHAMRRLAAYLELAKPRVTLLILLVTMAGFWLGSQGRPDRYHLLSAMAGTGLLAAGIFALNQYLERDLDAVMRRTEGRPLPACRLAPSEALGFGMLASAAALAWLAWRVNVLTAGLGVFIVFSYLFLYTPLKRRTPHCTFIGAFPGATPPLVGWAAARGELSVEAWVLFAILFLWQFPHFHSIAWLYREDYACAEVCMWPVIEADGKVTGRQIVGFTSLLVPVSLLPAWLGVSGPVYLWGAAALGVGLLYRGIRTAVLKSKWQARLLLLASVLYLPALFALMVLDTH